MVTKADLKQAAFMLAVIAAMLLAGLGEWMDRL